jgi:starch synthase
MFRFMEKTRVLIVTQEMDPYLNLSEISKITTTLPKHLHDKGMEIRVLMPKFGNINERRHRLHEVVRLSGINIIMDDEDYPLIIKVASLPNARLQVYFLDNEDFFKRKAVFEDENNKFFDDNGERMVFFCKGVLDTVKKFGWAPDIIHCHGWMTSLIPFYLKTAYKDEPIFSKSKVIMSVYENSFTNVLTERLPQLAAISGQMDVKELKLLKGVDQNNLYLTAVEYSDALIKGSETVDKKIFEQVGKKLKKPVLEHTGDENFLEVYQDFYNTVLSN